MRFRNRLLSGLAAAIIVVSGSCMTAGAADIQVDNQIPPEEVEGVYNQEINSNSLPDWPVGPNIYSESGIVMDMDSGAILYAKNIDDQHYPASITKVLTALVALENSTSADTVRFTQESIDFLEYGDAHIGMKPGEEISMGDAMYGMLLASANEVAYAIADNAGGFGYERFIQMMNERAVELGCTNSHWMNANGLHDDEHYTSARDMALIGSAAFQFDAFRNVIATREYKIPETAITNEKRVFQQNHKMIHMNHKNYYEYCVGGKTGFTDQALTTLITFATKDDMNLVAVTLRTHGVGGKAYEDTRGMLDYAFANFSKVPVTTESIDDKNIEQVIQGSYVVVPQGMTVDRLDRTFTEPKGLGEKEGYYTYTYNGQEVGKVKAIITDKYYNKLHGLEKTKKAETSEKKTEKKLPLVVNIVSAIVIILIIMMLILIYMSALKKKRRRELRRRRMREKRMRQRRMEAQRRKK